MYSQNDQIKAHLNCRIIPKGVHIMGSPTQPPSIHCIDISPIECSNPLSHVYVTMEPYVVVVKLAMAPLDSGGSEQSVKIW